MHARDMLLARATGFVAVAAGDQFSLGLKSDGTLVAWGQFDADEVPPPNRGYSPSTANRGLGDALNPMR
jgi:alpha-tubulin suppressor-like RCC1 family protein